jgi:hypothetical protein
MFRLINIFLILIVFAAFGCYNGDNDDINSDDVPVISSSISSYTAAQLTAQGCHPERSATYYTSGLSFSYKSIAPWGSKAPVPCLSLTGVGTGEPTISIAKDGTIFYAPAFTNEGNGVLRSKDNGATWETIIPKFPNGKTHGRVMPYMYMDPATDRIFFHTSPWSFNLLEGDYLGKLQAVLAALGFDFSVSYNLTFSADKGNTWKYAQVGNDVLDWGKYYAGPPAASGPKPTGYQNVVYMSGPAPISTPFPLVLNPNHQSVYRSLDGGLTWNEVGQISLQPLENGCSALEWIIFGNGAVAKDGTVYLGFRRCDNFAIAKSTDEGKTWTVINIPGAKLKDYYFITQVGLFNGNYVPSEAITVDSSGYVYAVYAGTDDLMHMAVTKDKGKTWSTPVVVSAPSVKHIRYAAVTVKSPGVVAIGYYGTKDDVDLTAGINGVWNGYIGESTNALSSRPTFWTATVDDPADPLYPHGFATGYLGMFLAGDLNEIVQVKYAPNGDIWASFNKGMCPNLLTGTEFTQLCPSCFPCKWDLAAHANSNMQGAAGRLIHR